MIFTLLKFQKDNFSNFLVINRNFGGLPKPGHLEVKSTKKVEENRVNLKIVESILYV